MPATDLGLLNGVPGGFLSFRDDGRVLAVNDHLLRLLGQTRDNVVGSPIENLLGVAGRIFFHTHLFPLVRMHGHADEIYVELRTKDGGRVPVLLNARRVEASEDDEVGGAHTHCVLMRVLERKKFEEQLIRAKKIAEEATEQARRANDAKSLYLRSVSHEIRTPINALLGYADLLDLGAGELMDDRQVDYVARMRRAARHLLGLVNDLLDLARIESGAMRVGAERADVSAALDTAFALVEPQAGAKEIAMALEKVGPGTYVGDAERVAQVLINLLSNAVKFTEPGGRIDVDWSRDDAPVDVDLPGAGPWLRVRVSDTGVGIPAERLDDVFQPFSQIEHANTGKGTGLGLTISRELARLMHGDLTVRSVPGEGSTFSLWLRTTPLVPPTG